jgi:hypothetical protein
MRHLPPHLGRRLILAQPLIDDLAQEIVFGPGQELDLGDQFAPHSMHAAENQRPAEAAVARRRHIERHCAGRERLQAPS